MCQKRRNSLVGRFVQCISLIAATKRKREKKEFLKIEVCKEAEKNSERKCMIVG